MPRSSKKHVLSEHGLELVARRFQVLSEPARLRLLMALREGEQNVTALVEATDLGQGNVSKHLGILADAHIVERRREGANVYYAIADPQIFELCELMCSKLEREFAAKSAHFR